ncbi:hypothetical protein ACJMK2_041925 [Sinanodonta woodiana]|uniref:Uncharacterized protein n=1 Tax=Sinanodonta woodiana TaxID=1069815 RepID=A0ABD3W738_SINWO
MERYKQNYGNYQRKLKLKLDRISIEQNDMLSMYEEEKRSLKEKENDGQRLMPESNLYHIHPSGQGMNPIIRRQADSYWDLTKAAKLKHNVSETVDNFRIKRRLVYYKPKVNVNENTTRNARESKKLTPLSVNDKFSRARKKVQFASLTNGSDRVMPTTKTSKSSTYRQEFSPGKESSEREKHKTSWKVSNPSMASLTAFPLSSIWNSKSSRGREHQSKSECGSPLKGRVKNKVIRNYLLQDVFKRLSSSHEKKIYRPTEEVGREQRSTVSCDYESLRECRYLRIPDNLSQSLNDLKIT